MPSSSQEGTYWSRRDWGPPGSCAGSGQCLGGLRLTLRGAPRPTPVGTLGSSLGLQRSHGWAHPGRPLVLGRQSRLQLSCRRFHHAVWGGDVTRP